LSWAGSAGAAVVVGDEGATSLTLSGRDLNVLTFPAPITMATSSRADLKAKPEGRNLIVQVKTGPADLVVMAGEQTYVFEVGVSVSLGAQTISIEDIPKSEYGPGSVSPWALPLWLRKHARSWASVAVNIAIDRASCTSPHANTPYKLSPHVHVFCQHIACAPRPQRPHIPALE